jgi:hypothetical protein
MTNRTPLPGLSDDILRACIVHQETALGSLVPGFLVLTSLVSLGQVSQGGQKANSGETRTEFGHSGEGQLFLGCPECVRPCLSLAPTPTPATRLVTLPHADTCRQKILTSRMGLYFVWQCDTSGRASHLHFQPQHGRRTYLYVGTLFFVGDLDPSAISHPSP